MEKQSKYTILAVTFGIFAFLANPVGDASAGSLKGYLASMHGYHGGGHRAWDRYDSSDRKKHNYRHGRKKGHVKSRAHNHDYKHYGVVYSLPFGAKKIKVKNIAYQYHNGVFYKKCNRGYDIVKAPHGAVVRYLPSRTSRSYKHRKKYYKHNGTYYKKARSGYTVVDEPHYEVSYHNNNYGFRYSSSRSGRYCH